MVFRALQRKREFPKYVSLAVSMGFSNSSTIFISKYPVRILWKSSISESEEAVPALKRI